LLLKRLLGPFEVEHAPRLVVEAARLSARRPGNARSAASLLRGADRVPGLRREGVLTEAELARIDMPTTFIWGVDDPYLRPAEAQPSIALMPSATLHELLAGHAPWLVAPVVAAALARRQLTAAAEYYTLS
jgi:pimeloyl-ACP methyl ester carboxylesterase